MPEVTWLETAEGRQFNVENMLYSALCQLARKRGRNTMWHMVAEFFGLGSQTVGMT